MAQLDFQQRQTGNVFVQGSMTFGLQKNYYALILSILSEWPAPRSPLNLVEVVEVVGVNNLSIEKQLLSFLYAARSRAFLVSRSGSHKVEHRRCEGKADGKNASAAGRKFSQGFLIIQD